MIHNKIWLFNNYRRWAVLKPDYKNRYYQLILLGMTKESKQSLGQKLYP